MIGIRCYECYFLFQYELMITLILRLLLLSLSLMNVVVKNTHKTVIDVILGFETIGVDPRSSFLHLVL